MARNRRPRGNERRPPSGGVAAPSGGGGGGAVGPGGGHGHGSGVGPGGGNSGGGGGYQYHGPWENVGQGGQGGGVTPGGYDPPGGGGGGGGGGGAGGGAGGGTPGPPPLPFDAGLQRYLSGIQTQADIAQGETATDISQLQAQFFDANNPFSNQALLQRNLQQAQSELLLQQGGAGALYSGQTEARLGDHAFRAQKEQDALYRDYMEQLTRLERGGTDAQSELTSDAEAAIFEYVQATAGDIGSQGPEYGKNKKKKKKNKGKGGKGK